MSDNFGPEWNQPDNQNGPGFHWNQPSQNHQNTRAQKGRDNFALASLICGILAIVSIISVVGPIFFGALAIVFGILAKGSDRIVPRYAKIGKIMGTIMLIISLAITSIAVGVLVRNFDSPEDFMHDYVEMMEDMGMDANDLERALEQYGIDLGDYGVNLDEFDSYDAAPGSAPAPNNGSSFDTKGSNSSPLLPESKDELKIIVSDDSGQML